MKKTQKGITLIALVITIIVLLILAVVAIGAVTGEDGIIRRAQQTKFLSDIGKYKEELELYKTNWAIEYQLNNRATTDGINDPSQINTWDYNEIKGKYIKSFAKKYIDKIGIKNGELVYQYIDNETEREWAEQSGLGVESEEITIEVGEEGLGTVSSSIEIKDGKIATKKGQTITITAEPGNIGEGENTLAATFKGWYNGETLITDKLSYTFKVAGSQKLTAKFEIETDATVIYYLDENGEETVLLDSTTNLSTYASSGTDKTKITKVEVGNNCVAIGRTAFKSCTSLRRLEIPNSENITYGYRPFQNCTGLQEVILGEIGKPVSSINSTAPGEIFCGCEQGNLTIKVYVPSGTTSLENAPWGATNATVEYYDATTGELVNLILGQRYNRNTEINFTEIPNEDKITEIQESAFYGCSNLALTRLPENITTIGGGTFSRLYKSKNRKNTRKYNSNRKDSI